MLGIVVAHLASWFSELASKAQLQWLSHPMEERMQIVQNMNQVVFSKAALADTANAQTIGWSQSLRHKEAVFTQLVASIVGGDTSPVLLFVEQDLQAQLLAASNQSGDGKDLVIATVQSPYFRYGQDSATNTQFRFLVYINPAYNPYQHRFVTQTTAAKLSDWVQRNEAAAADALRTVGNTAIKVGAGLGGATAQPEIVAAGAAIGALSQTVATTILPVVKTIAGLASNFIGDPLRSFEG